MRIFIDARTIQDHFPGIGRYVYNLIAALAPQTADEIIALVSARASNTRYDVSRLARHDNVRLLSSTIPVFHWREQIVLPRLIRRWQPDVVHFPYNVRPFWPGLPAVLTLYDTIPRRYPQIFGRGKRLQIELVQRLALRSSRGFVAISQATAADFQRFYGLAPARITITPLAADSIFRPQPPAAITSVRQRLGLPERYVLYVGSNKPHKNLPRLIEAYVRARRRMPALPQLIIAGHWDDRYPQARVLAAQAGLEDEIRFIGPVGNDVLPALYAGATLFVFPSMLEGFGLPVLEAMASGTPVACSNRSSLPEVAGTAAAMFDPEDTEAIAASLIRCLGDADLRQHMRALGLQQAARFSWHDTAAATLSCYRSLARGAW